MSQKKPAYPPASSLQNSYLRVPPLEPRQIQPESWPTRVAVALTAEHSYVFKAIETQRLFPAQRPNRKIAAHPLSRNLCPSSEAFSRTLDFPRIPVKKSSCSVVLESEPIAIYDSSLGRGLFPLRFMRCNPSSFQPIDPMPQYNTPVPQ